MRSDIEYQAGCLPILLICTPDALRCPSHNFPQGNGIAPRAPLFFGVCPPPTNMQEGGDHTPMIMLQVGVGWAGDELPPRGEDVQGSWPAWLCCRWQMW